MIRDVVQLSDSTERRFTRALQLVLVGLAAVGLARGRFEMVLTTGIALGITLLPALLRREYGYSMKPGLVLWITVAMLLHTAGNIGLYKQFQWYDEIAHTASAMLVAGVGYASLRALELHSDDIDVPSEFRTVFIVVFVLAAGMFWEVLEFAFPAFVVFGIDDIVTDLVFNAVGAMLVAVWGTGYLGGLVGFFRNRLRTNSSESG